MLGGHFSHISKRLEESDLQPAARLVLFVICSATDKRSGGSVIAASKLAKRTGLSEGHLPAYGGRASCRRVADRFKVGHNRNKYTIAAELPAIGVRAGARSVWRARARQCARRARVLHT